MFWILSGVWCLHKYYRNPEKYFIILFGKAALHELFNDEDIAYIVCVILNSGTSKSASQLEKQYWAMTKLFCKERRKSYVSYVHPEQQSLRELSFLMYWSLCTWCLGFEGKKAADCIYYMLVYDTTLKALKRTFISF